jgi:hypothetical protein
MARITVTTTQLASLGGLLQGVIRLVRRLALVGVASAALIAALLWEHGGFDTEDAVLTLLLLGPPGVLLFFGRGLGEIAALPERLRRMPGEGTERLGELTQVAGRARETRLVGLPLLLWRLRGAVGSVRDVAGFALPLKVLTPGFLGLTALSALLCVLLAGVALIALLVIAAG